jgi:2-polyprenyl-3-methyl-5-hydroxy-6-metoxy-1,4-benzoquinol methylase
MSGPAQGNPSGTGRHGARQPERFRPSRASLLDDRARLAYLPPDRIFALLHVPTGARVVDFGTGTGLFALELAQRRPDLEIIALDEQPEMLERLRDNPAIAQARNIRPTRSSELARLAGTVDAVLAINVLHELGDEATAGMAGLLKPSGRIVAVDWNGAIERPIGPPREHVYTPDEARARLQAVGLSVAEQAPLSYHFVLTAERHAS